MMIFIRQKEQLMLTYLIFAISLFFSVSLHVVFVIPEDFLFQILKWVFIIVSISAFIILFKMHDFKSFAVIFAFMFVLSSITLATTFKLQFNQAYFAIRYEKAKEMFLGPVCDPEVGACFVLFNEEAFAGYNNTAMLFFDVSGKFINTSPPYLSNEGRLLESYLPQFANVSCQFYVANVYRDLYLVRVSC